MQALAAIGLILSVLTILYGSISKIVFEFNKDVKITNRKSGKSVILGAHPEPGLSRRLKEVIG